MLLQWYVWFSTFGLVMTMLGRVSLGHRRRRGRRLKFCGEHENERCDNSERQDRVEFGQDKTDRPANIAGEMPNCPASCQTDPRGQHSATRSDFDARVAVRAFQAVGKSDGGGRGNFFAANWTGTIRHNA